MLRQAQHERISAPLSKDFSAHPELLSTKFLLWRAEVGGISCGISEQLLDIGIARGAYRGGEEPAALSELIAVRLRDLADDAMGAEQPQETTDFAREAARIRVGLGQHIQPLAQVVVAETGDNEFAAGDGL